MSLNLDDKKVVVAEVSAQVANAQTIVVAEYRGVQVVSLTLLRKKAREYGVNLRVGEILNGDFTRDLARAGEGAADLLDGRLLGEFDGH